MVAAGFWKHNIIAIPVTAISWLLFITRSPYVFRATTISAAACMIGSACCVFIFGPDFLQNLLANRQYALSHVIGNIGHLQMVRAGALYLGPWAFDARKSEAAWFAKRIGAGWARGLMIAVLLLRLVASDRQETALLMLSSDFRSSLLSHWWRNH
jgi:hypothetical protein